MGAAFKSSAKPTWCLACSQDRMASKSDGPMDRMHARCAQGPSVDGPVTCPVTDSVTTPTTRSAAKQSPRTRKKTSKKKTRA